MTTTAQSRPGALLPDRAPAPRLPRAGNFRQAYGSALAGATGAVFGLYFYVELVQASSVYVRDALAGVAIGGTIGFVLNAAAPFRDGAWLRLARRATPGAIAGAVGGAAGLVLGEVVIGLFQGGLIGRAVSWGVLGLGIGVSQGLAERSRQKLIFGVIGGSLGGAVGGYLFEALRQALGNRYDLSQGLGIAILGAGLGACLALVEQVLRRAWVQVLSGRQEGRVYLLDRAFTRVGLDERAEIGLFADAAIARRHAEIASTPEGFVLHNHSEPGKTRLNGKDVTGPVPLKDGDHLVIGQTRLLFRQR
ncbi:MAG: FHA domain-containing protein [Isosphaeraceae bacterium]